MKNEEMRDLRDLFMQHREILISLGNLLREERDALIKDDAQNLTKVIERKVTCVDELERLENIRQDKHSDIVLSYLEQFEEDMNNNDSIDKSLIRELKGQMRELQELSQQLWREQETNTLLIQQSMAYSNLMMHTIQDIIKKSGMYGKDGKMEQAPVKASLDRSV